MRQCVGGKSQNKKPEQKGKTWMPEHFPANALRDLP
jgi:hypothetical protein